MRCLAALLLAASAAAGQQPCVGPRCPTGPKVDWRWSGPEHDVVELTVDGRPAGRLDLKKLEYTDAAGQPWEPFVRAALPTGQMPPGGVSREKMPADGQERFSVCGKPCSKTQGLQALEGRGGDLTDDSRWPWLTVIGTNADRSRVMDDFRSTPALSALRLRLKGYNVGDVAVADFAGSGIYLQAPNGRPLKVWREYKGADATAKEINDALAGYDATKDPGEGKPYPKVDPAPPPGPSPEPEPRPAGPTPHVPLWGWAAGIVAVILFLLSSKRAA